MCSGGGFYHVFRTQREAENAAAPANELCGVMAMKYSQFHHHDCTTEQATRCAHGGLSEAGRKDERKSLNLTSLPQRTVSAKLPEYAHRVRT